MDLTFRFLATERFIFIPQCVGAFAREERIYTHSSQKRGKITDSGYPNLEESIRFAELVFPLLGRESIFDADQLVSGGGFEVGQTYVKAGVKRAG